MRYMNNGIRDRGSGTRINVPIPHSLIPSLRSPRLCVRYLERMLIILGFCVVVLLALSGCLDNSESASPQSNSFQVTVISCGASGFLGGGSYAKGDNVSIDAGMRDGYAFTGWTSTSAGVYFFNAASESTAFIMPANAVTVTANWVSGTEVNQYGGLPVNAFVSVRSGHRPIPVSDINGTDYADLLFCDRSGHEVFDRNNTWRTQAWDRIRQIRKGDFSVIVKDSSGNTVNGAKVEASMYEHEFKWGTAIGTTVISTGTNPDKYRAGLSLLFNAGVMENGYKWNYYESNPTRTENMFDRAAGLGIRYMRGHALLWDSYNLYSGAGTNNSIPQRVYDWFREDFTAGTQTNKNNIMNAIQTHIARIAGAGADGYRDMVYVWDVLNEPMYNHSMRDLYGEDVWTSAFDWARTAAGQDTLLFVNETELYGLNYSSGHVNDFKGILNNLGASRFDGIGIQSHFDAKVLPEDFYNMLQNFSVAYPGKLMEITEFDVRPTAFGTDLEYESSFTRDIMIAVFSQPNTNGFLMWGFWSGSHWLDNAPIFNADWSLKESGKQYIDLVYNKWWTQENDTTGYDGTCIINGYYGDYDITVMANGKTKTVQARFYKDNDNSITVVLE